MHVHSNDLFKDDASGEGEAHARRGGRMKEVLKSIKLHVRKPRPMGEGSHGELAGCLRKPRVGVWLCERCQRQGTVRTGRDKV